MSSIFSIFQENSIRFWYDEGIKTGKKWISEIAERINDCTAFVAFLSKNAIGSDNVKNELYFASEKKKRIQIVLLDDVELDDELILQFGRLQQIHRKNFKDEEEFIKKILNSVDPRTIEQTKGTGEAFAELKRQYRILFDTESQRSSNFIAVDLKTDAKVFIKHISFDRSYLGEIRNQIVKNEIALLKQLHTSPYCTHLLDYYSDDHNIYIVQNYVNGCSLMQFIDSRGGLRTDEAMGIAGEVAEILCYFYYHSPQLVHLDIKPENIMVPETGHVYLIDFGIATLIGNDVPSSYEGLHVPIGTVGFAPPEQYGGRVDIRSDIFSLGRTLLLMLCGKQALTDIDRIELKDLMRGLPRTFFDIVHKATAADPEDRYQTPMELLYDLRHYRDLEDTFIRYMGSKIFAPSWGEENRRSDAAPYRSGRDDPSGRPTEPIWPYSEEGRTSIPCSSPFSGPEDISPRGPSVRDNETTVQSSLPEGTIMLTTIISGSDDDT